ncbi:MAG: hypothetical protein R6X02_04485 [Enhygromyxa sp.]
MKFDPESFRQAVHERTGLDPEQATAAVARTFEVIGRALGPKDVDPSAALVPEALAEHLRRGATQPAVPGVLEQLAADEQLSLGVAKEHVQVILEELAGSLDEPARSRLAELLPDELGRWLVPWEPPPERRVRPPSGREGTLASGRPGSQTPLHEAGPDRGQHDSPAVTSDPHADTRLSSTEGASSDRSETTIAKGRPGSQHPISEAKD